MLNETRQIFRRRRKKYILIGLAALLVLGVSLYFLPPIRSRVDSRLETWRAEFKYLLHPPENVVFVPTEHQQSTPTAGPTRTPTATPLPDVPTEIPTATSTPLPGEVKLTGIVYANQCNRWNYCGPANLNMALKFWDWKGLPNSQLSDGRDQIASIIKPGENDPNKDFIERGHSDLGIMPYEMVNFVNDNTDFRALMRYGGNVDVLKRLIAAGFPVIVEKGYYQYESNSTRISWMGHYSFVTGYDEANQQFIWQDSYPNRCKDQADLSVVERKGRDNLISYDDLMSEWRSFNYIFMVVYPADREAEVLQALGPWADSQWAAQSALQTAESEVQTTTGTDQFFAYFNEGTSHVALLEYADAATAYDQAFALYASLPEEDPQDPKRILRPYRMLWYETGPYWAYFYSGRYQDVVTLASTTLNFLTAKPSLEESLYWRGMAEYALGNYDAAYSDMRSAVYFNKNMQAALAKLDEWGISP